MPNNTYSVLKLFTGLVTAALTARILTMINETDNVSNAANIKIQPLIFTWYAKFCNQLCIAHQLTGEAIIVAIKTSRIKSFEIIMVISVIVAPNTFLIPISLTRCNVL